MNGDKEESLIEKNRDPLVRSLNKLVLLSVKILAIFMVFLIWLSLADTLVHAYQSLFSSAIIFSVDNLIITLGDVLAVLIAIEIFLNVVFYLHKDSINVTLVLATALTAIARKVIVFDYKTAEPMLLAAIAAVILAVGISYWLIKRNNQ